MKLYRNELSNFSHRLETNGVGKPHALINLQALKDQNQYFKGTGGVSAENRSYGFLPAFRDSGTGDVYLSRYADGRLAPMHLLDGLPAILITSRTASGQVVGAKASVIAGFVSDGSFYTREQAANTIKPPSSSLVSFRNTH